MIWIIGGVCAAGGAAFSAWRLVRRSRRGSPSMEPIVLPVRYYSLVPTPGSLRSIRAAFIQQLVDGLQADVEPSGRHMLMLPTYVTNLPNGEESGDVYAVDVGGTNFRIMRCQLTDKRSEMGHIDSCERKIPKEVYTGPGTGLFDFFATVIAEFIGPSESLPIIGFCFSFPMKQTAIDKGVLLDWTKGFTCDGVVGHDPVALLSEALTRAGRPCRILALLNDTVGVLAAQRYLDPDTSIGVIIGTGTNGCYVEKVSRVTKWVPSGPPLPPEAETCINIEWGAFDSDALPRCEEDWEVDAATPHKGKYLFEKLLSGMYLGEVARCILLRLSMDHKVALFGKKNGLPVVPEQLKTWGGWQSAHISQIIQAASNDIGDSGYPPAGADITHFPGLESIVKKALGARPCSVDAQRIIYEVCRLVTLRSAKLVACALHSILDHKGWILDPVQRVTVAFDGGVYEQFAAYRAMLRMALVEMIGEGPAKLIHFILTHDGSAIGAAVVSLARFQAEEK